MIPVSVQVVVLMRYAGSMLRKTSSRPSVRSRTLRCCLLAAVWVSAAVNGAQLSQGVDAEAGLPYWQVQDAGMSLRLVQRLPDQTRAFFLARGFARADAEMIAQSCVFQTVLKNTSQTSRPDALEYSLQNWRVHRAVFVSGLKTREAWAKVWAARETPMPARIAFAWALLPTQQRNNPGDYNWGMTVFDMPPESRFDLEVVWHQFGKRQSAVLKGLHCGPDVHEATP